MTLRWMHLRLAAPLMAFGDVAIDHVGPTRDFPSVSALTGLFGNALGWRREEGGAHQSLQDRIVFGALVSRMGDLLTDVQNARLYEEEPGWTTLGIAETRNKGDSYSGLPLSSQSGNQTDRKWITHRRRRDYLADHECRVVLRLRDAPEGPDLDTLAEALDRPARPLFIGRKPCLPTARLLAGWVEGADVRAALDALGLRGRALWPADEGGGTRRDVPDRRNWQTGLHGGSTPVSEGEIA